MIKNVKAKASKSSLKVYTSVYSKIMNFAHSNFEFDVLKTCNFLKNIHKLQKDKIDLDHSRITSRICRYVHDFCNLKLRDKETQISCIALNMTGFNVYHILKAIRLSTWGTK